ncbi:cyclic peptide export ABC transporter [Nitrospirillum sp. BR 11752]|uniref:cyclic peptide export ABC transporter n=1 Tax=Nitrospirillum sp. BR 11752 TaxID=3104293 RepID=UPI002EAEC9FC|nr:cyclic peptide export ABC transporter [Nitrospirillum sp. BR 11752]
MNLIRLLARLGPGPLRRLLAGAALSALSSTLVLAVVNAAAAEIAEKKTSQVNLWFAAAFAVGVVVYALMETWMVARMGADLEEAIDGVRMELMRRLSRVDLWKLERFGRTRLYDSITQSTQMISANSHFLALSLRSFLLTIAVMVYIAWISGLAFLVVTGLLAFCAVGYLRLGRDLTDRQGILAAETAGLHEGVTDLFDGFKEQRLSSARSHDLGATFSGVSARVMTAQSEVHLHGWQQFIFGATVFNLIMGAVVFIVPTYSTAFSQQVVKVAAAVLFMSSPFSALMQTVTLMGASEAAAGRMLSLGEELLALEEGGPEVTPVPVSADFQEITLSGVEFSFPAPAGERPFVVGPIDLTLRRGETVFVTGGNGSGKSTFVRLLTGLYHPLRGTLAVDGVRIGPERYDGYRQLMATVFADFHLFKRLHDSAPGAKDEAPALMRWMEMAEITALEGDHFGRQDLSTGQKKRLGLVTALMERKPILILDEWAADQDPHFRQKFYREILPALKARGLTIIAVTHDDRYFDAADRCLRMEMGRIVREDRPDHAIAAAAGQPGEGA